MLIRFRAALFESVHSFVSLFNLSAFDPTNLGSFSSD